MSTKGRLILEVEDDDGMKLTEELKKAGRA